MRDMLRDDLVRKIYSKSLAEPVDGGTSENITLRKKRRRRSLMRHVRETTMG